MQGKSMLSAAMQQLRTCGLMCVHAACMCTPAAAQSSHEQAHQVDACLSHADTSMAGKAWQQKDDSQSGPAVPEVLLTSPSPSAIQQPMPKHLLYCIQISEPRQAGQQAINPAALRMV
jgi:hypothetical protein